MWICWAWLRTTCRFVLRFMVFMVQFSSKWHCYALLQLISCYQMPRAKLVDWCRTFDTPINRFSLWQCYEGRNLYSDWSWWTKPNLRWSRKKHLSLQPTTTGSEGLAEGWGCWEKRFPCSAFPSKQTLFTCVWGSCIDLDWIWTVSWIPNTT